jgi:hypothetical protein
MNTKSILVLIAAVIILNACKNQDKSVAGKSSGSEQSATNTISDSSNYTTVQWLDSVQQFGKVTDGEKVLISFHFKNTGIKPLIISNVSAGCGCTVPEKPEEPIQPGQSGIIKAEFNSSGRVGMVSKNVTVTCNTSAQNYTLIFEGEVTEKKQTQ